MNKNLLNKEVQEFIQKNTNGDFHQMLLRKTPFSSVSMQELVQQMKARKTAEKKFPFLIKEGIIFPPQLNMEQTSSQSTAVYKAQLVSGNSMIDLTSGFGIDAWFLSENFKEITLLEQNADLLEMVEHNWNVLQKKARFVSDKLEDFLKSNTENFDLIYLDPARRDENKNKVFLLEDLSPNLLQIQDELLSKAPLVVVKLSPLIDLTYLASVVKNLCEIHIVAVKNEVKEIVLLIRQKSAERIKIKTVNLESTESNSEFFMDEIHTAHATFSEPKKYMYLPNNTLLKSGAFSWISEHFQLDKLHPNTHIYTSDARLVTFPGRILEMEVMDPKILKKGEQYNIVSKNYPLKPEEIKKKYKLKDGGLSYLIFTQSQKGKLVLRSVS